MSVGIRAGATSGALQVNGVDAVTFDSTGLTGGTGSITGNINPTSLNSGQLSGFRNKIINGDMMVSQVNASTSVTVTAAAALNYTIDQWYSYCTGANVTAQRVAGTSNDRYRYQFTGAASVTAIGFAQRIEQANVYDLAGQTAIVGVDLSNSLLTTVTWTLNYANSADTFGTLASPTVTQIATGAFTVSNSLTRFYTPAISIPAEATTGLELKLTVGAQTSGTWVIGKVQLEQVSAGATLGTAFEHVPYETQLRWCQRYVRPISTQGNGQFVGQAFNATGANWVTFGVPMRGAVTLSQTTGAYTTNAAGANQAITTLVVQPGGQAGDIWLNTTTATGLVAGNATVLQPATGTCILSQM
jgi:hypothetical protein